MWRNTSPDEHAVALLVSPLQVFSVLPASPLSVVLVLPLLLLQQTKTVKRDMGVHVEDRLTKRESYLSLVKALNASDGIVITVLYKSGDCNRLYGCRRSPWRAC